MARSGDPIAYTVTGLAAIHEDTDPNDSDKVIIVPDDEEWEILSISAILQSTATVGNRRMAAEVRTPSSGFHLMSAIAQATQAASLTRTYTFASGVVNMTAFVSNFLTVSMPSLVVPPVGRIRIYDVAAIDAAADDLTVRMLYINRPL